MNRIFMIASGKGGTGKSIFASNLAQTLAFKGHRTALIDMDMGLRTLDLYLGAQNSAVFDMYDVISGVCDLSSAIIQTDYSDNLSLIAACQSRDHEKFSGDGLAAVLSELMGEYEFVILDCPPGFGEVIEVCSTCADCAILVVNPDYASVRDADAVEDYLIRQGMYSRCYVVNRIVPELAVRGAEMSVSEIDAALKCDLLGMIPEDPNFRASIHEGMPVVCMRDTYIAGNFDKIADRLVSR